MDAWARPAKEEGSHGCWTGHRWCWLWCPSNTRPDSHFLSFSQGTSINQGNTQITPRKLHQDLIGIEQHIWMLRAPTLFLFSYSTALFKKKKSIFSCSMIYNLLGIMWLKELQSISQSAKRSFILSFIKCLLCLYSAPKTQRLERQVSVCQGGDTGRPLPSEQKTHYMHLDLDKFRGESILSWIQKFSKSLLNTCKCLIFHVLTWLSLVVILSPSWLGHIPERAFFWAHVGFELVSLMRKIVPLWS